MKILYQNLNLIPENCIINIENKYFNHFKKSKILNFFFHNLNDYR